MYILGSHIFTISLHVHIGIPYVYSMFTCTYWDSICLQYIYMYILGSHMFAVCLHVHIGIPYVYSMFTLHIAIPYVYSMFTCTYWDPICLQYVYSMFTCTYWDPICLQYVYMYIWDTWHFLTFTDDVAGRWPATSSVHYTTNCNTQSSAPEDE